MHLPLKPSALQGGNGLQRRGGEQSIILSQHCADAKVARVVKRKRETRVKKLGFILILADCHFFVEGVFFYF